MNLPYPQLHWNKTAGWRRPCFFLEKYVHFWELRIFSCLITVLLFSCIGLYYNENNYGCYDNLNSVFLLGRCWIANAFSFRLLKSGITARTPNIFSVFLFDYIQQFHTNGLLKWQFRPNSYLHVTFRPLTLHHLCIWCSILYNFFFLVQSNFISAGQTFIFFSSLSQGQRANIEPWQLASSRERIYCNFFFKFCIIQELSYYFIRKKVFLLTTDSNVGTC